MKEILSFRFQVAQSIAEYRALKREVGKLDRPDQSALVPSMIAALNRLERA